MAKGWKLEPGRHALAAKGVPTGRKARYSLAQHKANVSDYDMPPAKWFKHPEDREKYDGIEHVEDEDLTTEGLIAKVLAIDEGEHGLDIDEMSRYKRLLGDKMPDVRLKDDGTDFRQPASYPKPFNLSDASVGAYHWYGKEYTGARYANKDAPTQLPIVKYKGRNYFVDFRLEELRDVKTAKPLKFTEMPEDAHSVEKGNLRGIRAETSSMSYIRGLDD